MKRAQTYCSHQKFTTLLTLAFQQSVHSLRTADGRISAITQILLSSLLLCLALVSGAIQTHLAQNLAQFLGADLIVTHADTLTPQQLDYVAQRATHISVNQLIDVTLVNNEQWQRAELKIVDEHYPVKGTVTLMAWQQTSEGTFVVGDSVKTVQSGPAEGEIWVDSRLFSSLQLAHNQTLSVGNSRLTVTHIIQHEPDRLSQGHSVAMRAMVNTNSLNLKDWQHSNAKYRYLVNSDDLSTRQLINWLYVTLPSALVVHKFGAHPLAGFWQRVENFLGLASVLIFLMAGVALSQSGRRQLKRYQQFTALCLTMGINKQFGVRLMLLQWLVGFVFFMLVATAIALILHWGAIQLLQQYFHDISASVLPTIWFKTVAVLLLLLSCFQLPIWLQLASTPIAGLIRQSQQVTVFTGKLKWLNACFFTLCIALLAALYSDNWRLTVMMLVSMLLAVALMAVTTWAGLWCAARLSKHGSGWFFLTLQLMKQRLVVKINQILGVGLSLFLLLFSLMLLKDIGNMTQQYTLQHDGNVMIAQANQVQASALKHWLNQHSNSQIKSLKPYFQGQLIAVNHQPLMQHITTPSESLSSVQEGSRIHFTRHLPDNNKLIAGHWWQEANTNSDSDWQQISVEEEVMTDLNLKVGDSLTFGFGHATYHFDIVASHIFQSGKDSITFWFQIPEAAIHFIESKHFLMGSIEVPQQDWASLVALWAEHPTLRLITLADMKARFNSVLAVVNQAIFIFTALLLMMTSLIFAGAIYGNLKDDQRKNALLLSFGQTRRWCVLMLAAEWLFTGVIACVGAVVGAWVAGQLIYQAQFSMHYHPDMAWLSVVLISTLALVVTLGTVMSRASLKVSLRQLLHE
ncbi:ABC transporter permease [Flocculibacter collagenilyticus]|uniref:ABC transporter permease n=1 Tax=Flocculibacter collagenilyticus TaxID=2744479 RepID=UPI0018F44471|nr:FtsX-like permease family protein [Flocculibacter collagenilyticus]